MPVASPFSVFSPEAIGAAGAVNYSPMFFQKAILSNGPIKMWCCWNWIFHAANNCRRNWLSKIKRFNRLSKFEATLQFGYFMRRLTMLRLLFPF
jgi:hypothetical protein